MNQRNDVLNYVNNQIRNTCNVYLGILSKEDLESRKFTNGEHAILNIPDVEKRVNDEVVRDKNGNPIMEPGELRLGNLVLHDRDIVIYYNGKWELIGNALDDYDKLEKVANLIIGNIHHIRKMKSLNPTFKESKDTWKNIQKEVNEYIDGICNKL